MHQTRQWKNIVITKIQAFRRQGFRVTVTASPASVVVIEDDRGKYLTLTYSDAAAFIAVSRELSKIHALTLADAYRLQGVRALQVHLQMLIPLDQCLNPEGIDRVKLGRKSR
ncbi:hypothetical protein [Marinobacter sp. ELB17]|uniref:hypothetical protein n=1 Tax=Marinobacter sp. ELB17 TaxID=270374 RepID=UPI0000F38354|nr:hypothetical protein [Marinobacter sp. ELB17]EAZ98142.1 hypothetical protein MELB17_09668 [Marinobacter sp. ELB17]